MSILGVILRTRPQDLAAVEAALCALPGVDIAERPDHADGRLVLVIEDSADRTAAALLGDIATWKAVLNTSLVYEYSGPDAPATRVDSYTDWRGGLGSQSQADQTAAASPPAEPRSAP